MSEGDAVKVCLRVRPLIHREQGEQVNLLWKAENNTISQVDGTRSFNFDRVFNSHETTLQVYQEVAVPIIRSALQGYNGTIFAYGQTSSGKTYTMMGTADNLGIIPQAVQEVFKIIQEIPNREFLLRVSYMEIYNETVTDLLCDDRKKKPLEVREDINRNVYVADLTEELVMVPEHVMQWIKKGEKNRHYGETKMNDHSSRSHTIFRMIVESRERNDPGNSENCDGAVMVSHLNLVDLAGSERASQTGAEGVRFKEGCNINRSLFILGQVIKKLSDGQVGGFINYRDSKLTRILQNSLGGNTKTVIICTITPVSFDETLSTLQFASTAKHVRNTPHVNEVLDDQALLKRYRKEIMDLKKQLEELEASSEIRTQAMAKEEHTQLLAEIKQLQKERENRIWNLTNIVVAASQQTQEDQRVKRKRRVTWAPGKLQNSLRTSGVSPFDIGSKFTADFAKRPKISEISAIPEIDDSFCTEFSDFEDPSRVIDDFVQDADWNFGNKVTHREKTTALSHSMIDFPSEGTSALAKDSSLQKCKELEQKVAELESQLNKMTKEYEVEIGKRESLEKENSDLKELQSKDVKDEMVQTLELEIASLKHQILTRPEVCEQNLMPRDHLEMPETVTPLKSDNEQQLDTVNDSFLSPQIDSVCQDVVQEQDSSHIHDTCREQIQMLEQKIADLEENASPENNEQNYLMESLQICEALMAEKKTAHEELALMQNKLDHLVAENESLKREINDLEKCLQEKHETNEFERLEIETQKEHETQLIHEISSLKKLIENAEVYNQDLENEVENKSKHLKELEKQMAELKRESEMLHKRVRYSDLTASLGDGEKLCEEVFQMKQSLSDAETVTRDAQREAAFLRSENLELKEKMDELSIQCEKREKYASDYEKQLGIEKSNYKKMQADLQKELQYAFNEINQLNGLMAGKVPKDLLSRVELDKKVADYSKQLASLLEEKEALKQEVASLLENKSLAGEVENLKDQLSAMTEELQESYAKYETLTNEKMKLEKDHESLISELKLLQERMHSVELSLSKVEEENNDLQQKLEEQMKSVALSELMNSSTNIQECESLESDLRGVREEGDVKSLQLEEQMLAMTQEKDSLLEALKNITAERDQLKLDLQENIEISIDTQEELRSALDELKVKTQLLESMGSQINEVKVDENGELNSLCEHLRNDCDKYLAQLDMEKSNSIQLQCEVEEKSKKIEELETKLEDVLRNIQETELKCEKMVETLELVTKEKEHLISSLTLTNDKLVSELAVYKQEKQTKDQEVQISDEMSINVDETRLEESEVERNLLKETLSQLQQQLHSIALEKGELQQIIDNLKTEKCELLTDLQQYTENEVLRSKEVCDLKNEIEKLKELKTAHESHLNGLESVEAVNISKVVDGFDCQEQRHHHAEVEINLADENAPKNPTLLEEMHEEKLCLLQEELQKEDVYRDELHAHLDENSDSVLTCRFRSKNDVEQRATQCHHEDLVQSNHVLSEECKLLKINLKNSEAELEILRSEKHDGEQKISNLQNQVEIITKESENLKVIQQSLMSEKDQLKDELEKTLEKLVYLEEEVLQNANVHQELIQKKEELQQGQIGLKCEIENLMTSLTKTRTTMESLQNEKMVTEQQLADLQQQIDEITQEKDELKASKERLTLEMASLKELIMNEENQQRIPEMGALPTQPVCNQVLNDNLKCVEADLASLNKEKSNLEAKLFELQEHMQILTNERDELKVTLQSLRSERDQLKEDLRENVEMSIEMQDDLRKTQDDLQQQRQKAEELTFKISDLEAKSSSVEMELQEANCEKEFLEQSNKKLLLELEHLHNDIKNKDCIVGQSEKEKSTTDQKLLDLTVQLNTVSEERDQIQLAKEELQKQSTESQHALKRTQEELQQQKQQVEMLAKEMSLLEEKSTSLERELQEKIDILDKAVEDRQNLDLSKQNLASDFEQVMEDLKNKDFELKQAEEEKEAASLKILELSSEMKSIIQERDDLQHSKENLDKEIKKLTDEIQQIQHEHNALTAQQTRKTSQLDELELELQQLQEKMNLRDASIKQLEADNVALKNQLQQYEMEVASLHQEQEQFQQLLQRARTEKENIYATLQDQEKAVAQIQDELITCQTKLQIMTKENEECNAQMRQLVINEKIKNSELYEKVDLLEKEITVLRLIQSESAEEEDELAERTEVLGKKNQEFKDLMVNISTVYTNHHGILSNLFTDLESESEAQKRSMSAIKESLSSTHSRAFGDLQTEHIKLNSQMQTLLNKLKIMYRSTAVKEEHYSMVEVFESELCEVHKRNEELILQVQSLEKHGTKWSEAAAEELKFFELEFVDHLLNKKLEVIKQVKDAFIEVQDVLNSVETDVKGEINCKKEFVGWLEELKGLPFDAKKLNDGVHQENRRIAAVIQQLTKKLKVIVQSQTRQNTMRYLNNLETQLQEKKEKNKELMQRMPQIAPSGDSNILEEENAQLRETLKNVQMELKKMQHRIQGLENELKVAKADVKQKEQKTLLLEDKLRSSTAESELSELQVKMTEKEKHFQAALKEIQILQEKVAKGAAPYKDEIDSLKSQVVRVEMDRMKLSKTTDQQIASLKARIEDKEANLRKLKEQLRRTQTDTDTKISSENSSTSQYPLTCGGGSGIVQSTAMLILQSENAALKREIEQYKKKCHQLSRNISTCEDELKKLKVRSETPATLLSSLHRDEVMSHINADKATPVSSSKSEMTHCHIASPGKTGMYRKHAVSPNKMEIHKSQPMSPNKTDRHSIPTMSPGNTGLYRKHPVSPLKTEGSLFSTLTVSPCKKQRLPEKDSPKEKFFDVRSKSLPYCPSKFFDNSTLGTLPDPCTLPSDSSACADSKSCVVPDNDFYAGTTETSDVNNWWDRAGKTEPPNDCKTS